VVGAVGALAGMTAAALYEKRFGVAHHPVTANLIQYGVGLILVLPPAVPEAAWKPISKA
jgi:hypothetical protein